MSRDCFNHLSILRGDRHLTRPGFWFLVCHVGFLHLPLNHDLSAPHLSFYSLELTLKPQDPSLTYSGFVVIITEAIWKHLDICEPQ